MTIARRAFDDSDHPTVRAVDALDDLVLRNVPGGIMARRLAPEVHAALSRAGVYRMLIPREAGGDDLPYPLALRVVERLARADGSVAWCAIIGAASSSFGIGLPPGVAEATLWRDPNAGTASMFAPNGRATPVDGGFRINGRWPFSSGCTDAAWFVAKCVIEPGSAEPDAGVGSPPTHRMATMPMRELDIHETWCATGLRATGSHDVEASDVFVPAERMFELGRPDPRRKGPLTRFPFMALLASSLAAVSVGLAASATDTLTTALARRAERLDRGVDDLLGSAMLELAQIEAAARSARTAYFTSLDTLWDAVVAGEDDLAAGSLELQLVSRHAATQAADVATRAHRLGGAAALHEEHPLQRAARDAQAVVQHGLFGLGQHEALGRALVSSRMAPRAATQA